MKFKRLLSAICVFSALSVQPAQAQLIDTYACDRCDEAGAIALARSKAPALNCSLNNAPGQIPTIEDQICTATQKTLIVANPQTRLAFKFNVHSEPDGAYQQIVTAKPEPLDQIEKKLLAAFYVTHQDFVQAVQSVGSQNHQTSQHAWQHTTELAKISLPTKQSITAVCETHPSHYLRSKLKQDNLLKELTEQIKVKMKNQSWIPYTNSKRKVGIEIWAQGGGFGLLVSFEHNNQNFFVHKIWDEDNQFHFNVSYYGELTVLTEDDRDDIKELSMHFDLVDSSNIDGLSLKYWFLPTIDVRKISISPCMAEYIKLIQVSSELGSGPFSKHPQYSGLNNEFCVHTINTNACSLWNCQEQKFVMFKPCNTSMTRDKGQ
jgi:hypothetical protein